MKRAKHKIKPFIKGTWLSFMRQLWPGISNETADTVLWSCSAFPCCSNTYALHQLRQARKYSRDPLKAVARSYRDLKRAMEKVRHGTPQN